MCVDYQLLRREASNPLYDCVREYPYELLVPFHNDLNLQERAHELAKGLRRELLFQVGPFLCCKSPASHIGPYRYAVDFLVPDGTVVCAADMGRVEEIVTSSDIWGPSPEFADHLNFITIAHHTWRTHHHSGPPEYHYWTQYCHLARGSEREFDIHVGDHVSAGQPIARTGKTGWTSCDHLHFMAFMSDDGRGAFGFMSLKPRFNVRHWQEQSHDG